MANFLQKPSGALVLLTTAIAGPYAAFETDVGVFARRVMNDVMGTASEATDGESSSTGISHVANYGDANQWGANPLQPVPIDPGSMTVPSLGYQQYGPSAYDTQPYGQQSYGQQSFGPVAAIPGPNGIPDNTSPQQQPYGQVAGIPPGYFTGSSVPANAIGQPQMPFFPAQQLPGQPNQPYSPSPILESNRGQTQLVQGGTQQLWDYTLGVPTLEQLGTQPQNLGGGEVHDLREVLRFDITPGWLPQRFSRVTTVLSNVQMDGLRVPLITGTKSSDLAGTLTYYFDASQTLQRINLHALTGDPSTLANLMAQYYGLRPEQSLGGQLFTARWNNRVFSVLHIAPAPIMYAGADHSKYIVFLELNQTGANFALSEEAGAFMQNVQATQRW